MFHSALFLVVFGVGCCIAVELKFHDCGSHGATINAVVATECTSEPCTVQRGSDYHGYVNFTATKDSSKAHSVLHGGISLFSLPWSVPHPNACEVDLPCPLVAGQTYQYKLDMHCPAIAPKARITAKWEIKDEHRHDIICFVIPMQITD